MSDRNPDEVRAALSASETLTNAILRSATDFAIIATDRDSAITTWNSGAEAILGWPAAVALGQPIAAIFTPEDRAASVHEREMATADRDGRAADDRWHLRGDGTRFFASGSMMPLLGANGAPHGYLKILRDRTEARAAEEAREATALVFQALVAAQLAVDLAGDDLDAVMDIVAQSARSLTRRADGAVVEMRDGADIVYRAAAGSSKAHVGLRLQAEGSFSGLCLKQRRALVCADTETDDRVDRAACRKVGVASMLVVPVPHRGEHVGVLKFHSAQPNAFTEGDVPTAQLLVGVLAAGLAGVAEAEAASALRTSETQLRLAQEAGGVGTFVWDLASGTVVGSDTFRAVIGSSDKTIPARQLTDAIHPDDRPGASAAASGTVDAGSLGYQEFRIQRFDNGETRWIARRGEMVRDAEGRFVQGIGVVYDVTERKRTEEMLRQLNVTLESRVEERSQALQSVEEQLRQSQKMEALGQLTGGIAHDFNNVLAGVVGPLDLLQTRLAQGRTAGLERYVSAAQTSANRAAAMTHRLLAFARHQPLDPKPTDVNALVSSMEDLLRRTSGAAVGIDICLAAGLWSTACDANQLENALLNLAINARDAMPDGGRLTIRTSNVHLDAGQVADEPEAKPSPYVCLAVSDTGTGMPPDVIAKAFDPFFTTKPLGRGTGLGLSMVQAFVKQAGGQVQIDSRPGRGTSVQLFLPRLLANGDASEKENAPDDTATAVHVMTDKTVLIVEDEAIVRMLVVEVAEELGYRTLEAGDGKAALAMLEAGQRIDLLVTDVGLPGIGGRQLAERAREVQPGLKVLFITGYADSAASGTTSEADTDVMSKPFAIDALAAKLQAMTEMDAAA